MNNKSVKIIIILALLVIILGIYFGKGKSKMGFFKQIFEKKQEKVGQAVLVHIKLSDDKFGAENERQYLFTVEDKLEKAINDNNIGEFDGNEFGEGECIFYMYGIDADKIFQVINPILLKEKFLKGSYIIKRFGEPGAEEIRIDL